MMLLNTSLLLYECDEERKQSYEQKIRLFAEEILHYFYKKEKHAMFETVGMNGEYDASVADYRVINPGHCMEASWFLSDAGAVLNDEEISACGRAIFEDAFRAGWDTRYGGIFYFVDYEKKPVFAYEHDMKLWWPHNEGVLASLKLYERTGDAALLECFRMIDEYAFSHFSDAPYGEWFGYLRRTNKKSPRFKGALFVGAVLRLDRARYGKMEKKGSKIGRVRFKRSAELCSKGKPRPAAPYKNNTNQDGKSRFVLFFTRDYFGLKIKL